MCQSPALLTIPYQTPHDLSLNPMAGIALMLLLATSLRDVQMSMPRRCDIAVVKCLLFDLNVSTVKIAPLNQDVHSKNSSRPLVLHYTIYVTDISDAEKDQFEHPICTRSKLLLSLMTFARYDGVAI